ncbi:hypothetical protein ACFUTX_08340 [Microbacterium sp. NPDC057407]|uniref:hypothetical protein n=1 Tax=Microbacterium sp. NPDC057407 TaxID=3346120 RepID=UPI00366F91B4
MNPDDKSQSDDSANLSEQESLRKDMSYSPASETETRRKQEDPLPEALDDDIAVEDIKVVPGTGGPDDVGDVEVDPEDLNLPGRGA